MAGAAGRRPCSLPAAMGQARSSANKAEARLQLLPSPRRPACSWPLAFGVGKRCRICPHPRSRQQLQSAADRFVRRETLRKRLRQSVPQLAWHTRPRRFLGRRRPPKYACFGHRCPKEGPDFLPGRRIAGTHRGRAGSEPGGDLRALTRPLLAQRAEYERRLLECFRNLNVASANWPPSTCWAASAARHRRRLCCMPAFIPVCTSRRSGQ